MKILPNNPPEPSREPSPEPDRPTPAAAAPLGDLKDQMRTLLQEFAEHTVEDLHALETKLEQSQARVADQAMKQNQTIARIIDEIGDMKKTLAERPEAPAPVVIQPPPPQEAPRPDPLVPEALQAITREIARLTGEMSALRTTITELKPVEPVKIPEPPKVEPEPRPILLDDFAGAAPSIEPEGKKVAFLTKLWDYLNTVAIEIPLGR